VFAVILGLALTLIVLALLQRPLPALPFSLLLGVLFFIIGALTFRPFGLNLRTGCLAF
jgi:presenilin 1